MNQLEYRRCITRWDGLLVNRLKSFVSYTYVYVWSGFVWVCNLIVLPYSSKTKQNDQNIKRQTIQWKALLLIVIGDVGYVPYMIMIIIFTYHTHTRTHKHSNLRELFIIYAIAPTLSQSVSVYIEISHNFPQFYSFENHHIVVALNLPPFPFVTFTLNSNALLCLARLKIHHWKLKKKILASLQK